MCQRHDCRAIEGQTGKLGVQYSKDSVAHTYNCHVFACEFCTVNRLKKKKSLAALPSELACFQTKLKSPLCPALGCNQRLLDSLLPSRHLRPVGNRSVWFPTDHRAPSSAREPPLAGCFLLSVSINPRGDDGASKKSASSTSVRATALRSKTLGFPFALVLVPVFGHFHRESLCEESQIAARLRFSDGGSEEETQRGAGEGGGEGAEAERRGVGFAHPEGPATVSELKLCSVPGSRRRRCCPHA